MNRMMLSRRNLLLRGAAIGCSAAASPLMTPLLFAAAPWETRLVVIVLRGALDGLDLVQPYGDPAAAALRPGLGMGPQAGASDLDGFFALHPGLAALMPLWSAGELAAVHAVCTPYRDKRSHFDGQDILEAGTGGTGAARDGWLNRALQAASGAETQTAFAIGQGDLKLLSGAAPVAEWSPEADLALSEQAVLLLERMAADDPAYQAALAEALMLSGAAASPEGADGRPLSIARFAAEQLSADARIAAFSMGGWDTHRRQGAVLGRLLPQLAEAILELKRGLGPHWSRTAVVAVTEFGRTARENGSGGTDHGTGGAMLLAGGALRGGRVHGAWPGLAEADLYDRRDLMPTRDLRAHLAWLLRSAMGLPRAALEGTVFPGLDMGADPGLLL